MYQDDFDWNYSDLEWEIRNYGNEGFKFLLKGIFYDDEDNGGRYIIYCEFLAVTEEEAKKYSQEWRYWSRINYLSVIINAKSVLKFIRELRLYKKITYMREKDNLSEEEIKKKVQSDINNIEELNEDDDLEDENKTNYFYKLLNRKYAHTDLYNISFFNFNYNSRCKYSDFDPTDYSQSKDSTTGYYQLDFSATPKDLHSIGELVDAREQYYTNIFNLIFKKFKRDLDTKDSNLRNKMLFIFPREHIGKVELELKGNQLKIKTLNMNSEELVLKIEIVKNDPLTINTYDINLEKDIEEHEIVLDFIPEIISGSLLDVYDDGNAFKRIQKIVRRFDKVITDEIDEKVIRNIILEGEGLKTDFKEIYPHNGDDIKRLNHKKIIRLICAFANAKGGLIIFGVNDDAKIKGYKVTNQFINFGDFEQNLQRLCNDEIEPSVTAKCHLVDYKKKKLIVVQVFEYTENFVQTRSDKKIVVRKGSTVRNRVPEDLKKYPKEGYSEY